MPDSISSNRLISLDAFRGFTIAGMIIVNNPGSWSHAYPQLLHAEWHGITATDLVFPFFLFIMGVSIPLAFSKRIQKGADKKDLFKKISIRSIKIFLLGVFLNIFPAFDFAQIRWAGVLQRIAIVYFVSALLFLKFSYKGLAIIATILLVGYWISLTLIPIPGGIYPNLDMGTNFAAWVDSVLLPGRLWQGTWDPEGLLSTIPAIASGISGVLVGMLLLVNAPREKQVNWMFVAGFAMLLVGEVWSWVFPVNKNLWTSSYVLYTSGLAALTLAFFIWLVDMQGYKKWTNFGVIYGSNAITIYVLAGMLPALTGLRWGGGQSWQSMFFNNLVAAQLDPKFVSLLWAILYCLVCFIPAYILYKKKIFIKV
jgi:predicted acyltransferase